MNKMKNTIFPFYGAMFLCSVLLLFSCGSGKGGKETTVAIQKRTINQEFTFSARVLPFNASGGYAPVAGIVAAVKKIPGSLVQKEEVIVEVRDQNNKVYPVRAAADGILLAVYFSEGEYTGTGSGTSANLFTIGDTGRKVIVADLDEIDARKVKIGQPFTIRITDSVSLPGIVDYINNIGTETNGLIRFRLSGQVSDPGNIIQLLGVSLPVQVVSAKAEQVLSVEKRTVITRDNRHFLRVSEGKKTIEKEVSTGIDDGNYVEIKTGVAEGDKILVD